MCNDYGNRVPYSVYVEAFSQIRLPLILPKAPPNLEPRDDIWPTDIAPVIRRHGDGVELAQLRWGLAPGRPKAPPVINFRSEGRRFPKGRCLVPASHFLEFTGAKSPKAKWKFTKAGEDCGRELAIGQGHGEVDQPVPWNAEQTEAVMYQVRTPGYSKKNQAMRWALPDRVFFACGACHLLAHAFLERHGRPEHEVTWIKPSAGHIGSHIFVSTADWVFDYHGYRNRERFLEHAWRQARRRWSGWDATLVVLLRDVLTCEAKSRTFEGLWLREPHAFLHDPTSRARRFLDRFDHEQSPHGRCYQQN